MKVGCRPSVRRVRRGSLARALGSLAFGVLGPIFATGVRAEAASTAVSDTDRHELWVRGETYAALFRRALLPGPGGALVTTDTLVPVRQSVLLRARDLDTPWAKDSVDAELSAWGDVTFGPASPEHRLNGDIQAANIGYRQGPLSFRLGRQHLAGGAARYARFDGASAGAELSNGLSALVYGGLTVLPRWDERPGYHYLGAVPDSDLRNPNLLLPVSRASHTLFGGRLGYRADVFSGGLSVHDQHVPGGIERLDVGADGRADVSERTHVGASAILNAVAARFSDVRLFVDTAIGKPLDLSLEYLHTEPALLLSRQSVLAVFSTDSYDEIGGTALARLSPMLSLEGTGFAQVYDTGRAGARTEEAIRIVTDRDRTLTLRVGYSRVQAPINGYHSVRTSLVKRITQRVTGTLEAYGYFYDEAIAGYRASQVYTGTVSTDVVLGVRALFGASIARSPYAALDAEAQARLSVDLDLVRRRHAD